MIKRKLILASRSPQRKKLLKQLGLPFSVEPSKIDEMMEIKSTPASLVKENALLKARDIASRKKEGLVLGSDTIVYIGNKKIMGKPKNLKEAKKNLKLLMSKPQWIYTGVALINAKTGKELVDYEKTRVHMLKLTDKEIDRYHKKVSPLDKAGGFDIEGRGAAFIHRIEGCYTNVIGLPVAKLGTMFKKFGINILSLGLVLFLSGCMSEFNLATRQKELYMHSTDKEIKIGDNVAKQIEKKYEFIDDVDVNERINGILDRLVAVCDRKDIVYFIKVIDDEEIINAISLPGGYVYLFKGLYDKLENNDELAGVIAHEVGHITARHGVKRLQASYGALLLQIAAVEGGGQFARGVNLALTSLFTEHSQQDEYESDRLGVKYMQKAGFDPRGMMNVLEILDEDRQRGNLRKFSYFKTHPNPHKRKAVVNKAIVGKLGFKDYVNLIGEDLRE